MQAFVKVRYLGRYDAAYDPVGHFDDRHGEPELPANRGNLQPDVSGTDDDNALSRCNLGLETFDELARLAHKMNNPLTSLIGRAQLLQLTAGEDQKVDRAANVIEQSAGRIAAHVRELSDIVRDAREALAETPHPADETDVPV